MSKTLVGASRPVSRRVAEGSGGGCFPAGTKILTPNGTRNIEDMQAGDTIWAFDEKGHVRPAAVKEVHTHEAEQVCRYEYWGGEVRATPNHWVLNQYSAFAEIGSLEPDKDALVDYRGHLRPLKSAHLEGVEKVYNFTVEPYHTYFADGIRVHNGGGGKGGGGTARVPVEAPNTLRSVATARVLDLLGEGVMGGLVNGAQSIFFDDTPLENSDGTFNFQGVSWDIRLGYPDQDPIPGFDEVQSEQVVETQMTRRAGPLVRTISNTDIDAARLRMRFPNLSFQDPNTGDLKPTSVEIRFEVKPSNGGYRDVPFVYEEDNRTGETTTGPAAVGFRAVVSRRILVKLNSLAETTFELQYRKVGQPAWISMGQRDIKQIIKTVPNVNTPDSYIDGQAAYYMTFTTSYSLLDLGANEYELQLVQGDSISSFVSYQRSNLTIEGKNTAPTEKSYRFSLPGEGPWLLRVSRITEDSEEANVNNTTFWASYTEIIEEKLIYPDTCYIGLAVNSELFGNSIPKRSYDVYGREVFIPSNYDPVSRTYIGFWDGTFKSGWTDNPAWCFMDMLINDRFGLGNILTIDQVDTPKLYEVAQYCDELVPDGQGGLEPRFTLNCVINTRTEAYHLLNTLVSVFRGMVYWASGSVSFGYDAPRDMDVIVGRANTIGGEFIYSTSSERAQHNSVLVTWNDPTDSDRPNIEVVEDNRDIAQNGLRQTDVYAFGCKSRGQAHRFGRWILYTAQNEIEVVTYRASLDHLTVVPGMVAHIVDPRVSGAAFAGRVMSINGNIVTLDREVTLAADETYEFNCMDDNNRPQTRAIVSGAGTTTRSFQINSPFTNVSANGRMWSISGTDVEPRPFRIISIVELENHIFEVTGIEYNPSKHDYVDRERKLEPVNYTLYSSGQVMPPTEMDIRETLFKTNNQVRTRASISWKGSSDNRVFLYRFAWQETPGGIMQERYTSEEGIEINDLEPGIYNFYVFGVAAAGNSVALKAEGYEILGKTAPPADVQNLRADRKVNGVILTWDIVTDLDLVGYEIRKGANWDTAEYVADIVANSLFVPLDDTSDTTLLVRAKDQLGILSENVTSVVSSVIAPDCPPVFTAVAQADYVLFRWTRVAGVDNTYEIRRGQSWQQSEQIGVSSGDEMLILDPQRDTAIYWIRSRSTAGLYSTTSRAASALRALIPDRNIVLEYDNQNDGGAGAYPGYTFNMEPGDEDTLLLASDTDALGLEDGEGSIELEDGTSILMENSIRNSAGEHYFPIDLGTVVRARNWLETTVVNLVEDGPTWDQWNYAWNALESQVTWLPLGDISQAQLQKVIAWKRDPLDEELYAFSFQDTLTDFRGVVTPDIDENTSYEMAKFGNGVFIHDLTELAYDITVNSTFSMMFKLKIDESLRDKRIFAVFKNEAEGDRIEIGYDAGVAAFYVLDSEGNYFTMPVTFSVTGLDYLVIGFVQAGNKRTLYYKSEKEYTSLYVEAAIAPLENAFDKVYLYNAA